jgi:hypothetical protein
MEALQEYVDNFTYLGIFAVLLLGSLGVPIPEEMRIIAAALLSYEHVVRWWLALSICLLGVLFGDMVPPGSAGTGVSRFSTGDWPGWCCRPAREQWLKAASLKACTEDGRHPAARHGTSRRRVSDRGQCRRSGLEVRGG